MPHSPYQNMAFYGQAKSRIWLRAYKLTFHPTLYMVPIWFIFHNLIKAYRHSTIMPNQKSFLILVNQLSTVKCVDVIWDQLQK